MNHWSHIVQESVIRRRRRRSSESERRKTTTHMPMVHSPYWIDQHFPINIRVCQTQGWKLCQLMFLDPWCMISQEIAGLNRDFLLRKHLHACIISEVNAAWPWSRKPRRGVQHCLERKKQRWTWKGLLQFDENCTVHTTNHRCKHSKLKTRVANHHRSFYSSSDITHYKIQKLSRHKIEEEVHRALAWLPKWYFLEFL